MKRNKKKLTLRYSGVDCSPAAKFTIFTSTSNPSVLISIKQAREGGDPNA